jgi:hypothetical protein
LGFCGLADEEEVEEFEADGVALVVEAVRGREAKVSSWWAPWRSGEGRRANRFSKSWMPVTRFCA